MAQNLYPLLWRNTMKIAVIEDYMFFKRLERVKKEIYDTDNIEAVFLKKGEIDLFKDEDTIFFIPYKLFDKVEELSRFSIYVLIADKEGMEESIKLLRKGAVDIVLSDFDDREIRDIILSVIRLYKKAQSSYIPYDAVNDIGNTLIFSNSFKDSLNSAIKKIYDYIEVNLFLSIVKNGKEKIVCGIGKDIDKLKEDYKKKEKHEWLKSFDNRNYIFIEEANYSKGFTKIPLRLRGKIVGVLTVEGKLNSSKRWFLVVVSIMLSLFIENFRIYSEILRQKEKEHLREKKEAIQEIINSFNHEVNNPLTIALLSLERMKRKIESENFISKKLENIEEALERIKEGIERIDFIYSGNYIGKNEKISNNFLIQYKN